MGDKDSDKPTSNTAGNQPSLAEIDYITDYLNRQLYSFEALNPDKGKQSNLLSAVTRARTIESAVADLLSPDGGNYQGLIEALNRRVNLEERLAQFLTKGLALLDDADRGMLAPKNFASKLIHDPRHGYTQFDLDEYLIRLERTLAISKVPVSLRTTSIWRQFVETANMLVDYLAFIIDFPDMSGKNKVDRVQFQPAQYETSLVKSNLIFLLRDTLLLYLGARRLQAAGVGIDARAAMISRALIQSFTPNAPNNPIYAGLYNRIYSCLSIYRSKYSFDFVDLFRNSVRQTKSEPEAQLLNFISQYLNRLCGHESDFLVVDNAAHGTMPLLAMSASNTIREFRLYSGTPWLQEFFGKVIYRPDFPHMRMLETLVCQEELFRFSRTAGDRVIIEETRDPEVQAHAIFEIGYFLDLVDARFLQ